MKKVLILLIGILIISGCGENKEVDYKKIMKENKYIIIDVRTNEEYEEKHIVNSINIPYDKISEEVDLDKNTIIFVYCRSGNRSNIAYKTLTELGYTVYDLGSFDNIDLEKE